MAYNNFTLDTVKNRFKLRIANERFCESLSLAEVGLDFLNVFSDLFESGEAARTEKAKSELLISPTY
jgi:hypothetical protein